MEGIQTKISEFNLLYESNEIEESFGHELKNIPSVNTMVKLKQAFQTRWRNLLKKSNAKSLRPPNKEELWKKVLKSYASGFKCAYCGRTMRIKDSQSPYFRSFSIDHKLSLDASGDNSIENLEIVCHRCNIVKGTIKATTFASLLTALKNSQRLLDRVFEEIWRGRLANKLGRENREILE